MNSVIKKIGLLFLSAAGVCLSASGQQTETRHVAGFTGIRADHVFVITVVRGDAESLVITADEHIMPHVRSEVRNGVLELSLDHSKKTRKVQTLKATVTLKELTYVELSGACRLSGSDVFAPAVFTGRLSGVAALQLSLKTGELSIDAHGANEVDLNVSGTNRATLAFGGGTTAKIALTATEVECTAVGSPSIRLNGSAERLSIKCSGAAVVRASDFKVKRASVQATGANSVELHVTETLYARASGASSVRYRGNPSSFDVVTGNAAQLKRM
jgi:hypothetical protein